MAKVWVANVPMGEIDMFKRNYSRPLSRGRPVATQFFTTEQLENMGFVGLYENSSNEEQI